jgi:hypothetical protein
VCKIARNAQLKDNCNVENPVSSAALAGRAPGCLRNMFIASFTRVSGR